jgi:rubredoxin
MQLGKEARPGPWNGLAVCDYTFDGQQEDARQAIAGGKQQLKDVLQLLRNSSECRAVRYTDAKLRESDVICQGRDSRNRWRLSTCSVGALAFFIQSIANAEACQNDGFFNRGCLHGLSPLRNVTVGIVTLCASEGMP